MEKYDNQTRKYRPDIADLSLYNGDEVVGVARFDITRYIDQGARTEKAQMIQPGEEVPEDKVVMKGNSIDQPEAYIIYRIFVDSLEMPQ